MMDRLNRFDGSANGLGVPPCWRAYFFLLRQEKVAKKKATPGYAVGCADSPALLGGPGGCGTRGYAPQTVLADGPRSSSVARRSTWGPRKTSRHEATAQELKSLQFSRKPISNKTPLTHGWFTGVPMRGAEQRRNVGGLRRGLFEGAARVPQPPDVSSSARNRATPGADPGVAFSLATFFWRSKRKYARQQGGTPS
jgi:hypothetical protein